MGVKIHLGSFGVTGVKMLFSQKNAVTRALFIARPYDSNMYIINVTHAYASGWPLFKTYWLKFRFGIIGVKRFFFTKNAVTSSIRLTLPVPLAKGAVSSSFFLSFFLSNNDCFFFHMLDWMFTKLSQKHVWVYGYKTYGSKNSPGVIWGHKGQKR